MRALRLLPLLFLASFLVFACETIDLSDDGDSASTSQQDTDSSDDSEDEDYVSDSADFRGYGYLATYLKHYGTDSLHCIPLIDLLEGGCVYEAFYESSDNQTTISASARWVGPAVIVGYVSSAQLTAKTACFTASGASQTNILVGTSADEDDYLNCVPVQLSTSSTAMQAVRSACNLSDNPGVLGQRAKFYGKIQTYFGVIGLKSVSNYTFTSDTVLTETQEEAGDESVDDEEGEDDSIEEDDSSGEEDDSSDDGTDDDTSSNDDTEDDLEDDDSDESDENDFNGYGSIDAYMNAYGDAYDNAVPLSDCIEGGCLYEYYVGDPDNAAYYSDVWVGPGYIVGYLNRSISSCVFSADGAVETNVLLGISKSTQDASLCMPINLETNSSYIDVRNAYNLADNPDSLGIRVVFYGNFTIKYGTLTLTHVKDAVSLPSPTQPRHAPQSSSEQSRRTSRKEK